MRFRPRVLGTATALLLGLCLALVPVANGTATGTTAGTTAGTGEVGAWSAPACVTTPVDDHRFHIGALWDTDRDLQHYKHTITRTRHPRAELRLADVKVRNLWLLYDRLPSGGSVAVYLNKRHLANVDLAGSHQFRARVLVEGFERARRGTLRIVVRSSRRDVRIDGAYAMP